MFPPTSHGTPHDRAGGLAALYLALAYLAAMPFFLLVVDYPKATTAAEKVASIVRNYQSMYTMYLVTYVFLGVVMAGIGLFILRSRGGAWVVVATICIASGGSAMAVAVFTTQVATDAPADATAPDDRAELLGAFLSRPEGDPVFRFDVKNIDITMPFPRLTYKDAMDRYGSDKPDTRFGLELKDVSDIARASDFKVFVQAIELGGQVKGFAAPGMAKLSRKEVDDLTNEAKVFGAKGLAWIKVTDSGFESPIAKFFKEGQVGEMAARLAAKPGDIMLFIADSPKITAETLGYLRLLMGKRLNLMFLSEPQEVRNCQVLFLSSSLSRRLPETLEIIRGRPILTIGDTDGYAQRGIMINMYLDKKRVRFEINTEKAEMAGLRISTKLLSLAGTVYGPGRMEK